jgi:hypothetical protein
MEEKQSGTCGFKKEKRFEDENSFYFNDAWDRHFSSGMQLAESLALQLL